MNPKSISVRVMAGVGVGSESKSQARRLGSGVKAMLMEMEGCADVMEVTCI